MDAGFERLQRRGLMTQDEKITDAGRVFREQIEVHTDELERPVLEVIGADLDEVLDHLHVWSGKITAAGLVPPNDAPASAGGGPHFGTGLTIDTAAELYEQRR